MNSSHKSELYGKEKERKEKQKKEEELTKQSDIDEPVE